jgi:FkbM family methyltransferase
MNSIISKFQKWIANQNVLSNLVIKLYNQTRIIIGYRFTQTKNFYKNGEFLVLNTLAGQLNYIVDVGANSGDYIDSILSLMDYDKLTIDAYEPSVATFKLLSGKMSDYNGINTYNIGLGSRKEEMIFYENPNYSETSSFVEASIDGNTIPITVLVDTIDNIYFDKGIVIDFMKIDTEGFDYNVLLGSEKMLASARIRFLQFEYNDAWKYAGNTLFSCLDLLTKNNFTTFIIQPNGLFTFDYSTYGEFFRYSNFFSVHEQSLDSVKEMIKGKR